MQLIRVGFRMKCVIVALFLSQAMSVESRADALDRYAANQLKLQRIAGLSLAVVKGGKIVKAKGYGLANVETGTVATADTVYKIGSISKSFLAAAIMMLVEDGRLQLNDPIDRYCPGAPETWKSITIQQLLTHTSGLIEDPPGFAPFKMQPDTEVISSLYNVPLKSKPGERWSYSNAGYFILADIIRQASGKPWAEFIQTRIFRPLKMAHTRVTTTSEVVAHRAEGYIWNDGRFTKAEDWVAVRPSGAFLSTVLDLVKWDSVIRERRLLKSASWDRILTPVKLSTGSSYPYGFGLFLDTWQGHRQVHHEGQLPGFLGAFQNYPDDRLTVIMLTNTDEIDQVPIAHTIAGFYVHPLSPPQYQAIADHNLEITAKVRRFVASFVTDAPDRALFPEDMANQIVSDISLRNRVRSKLRKWGAAQSLEPVEVTPRDGLTYYRYRLTYQSAASLLIELSFDPNGLIRGWSCEADASRRH
jgi:CubicO group peptidase (beta-lactamase class C family)